jgi:hypothetical protein
MTITKTIEVPASHRLTIDVPSEIPAGPVVLTFTPKTTAESVPDFAGECPICAAHDYMPNAETIAAIEEGRAMMRGEIPAKRFHSLAEMIEDLERDDPDDPDD